MIVTKTSWYLWILELRESGQSMTNVRQIHWAVLDYYSFVIRHLYWKSILCYMASHRCTIIRVCTTNWMFKVPTRKRKLYPILSYIPGSANRGKLAMISLVVKASLHNVIMVSHYQDMAGDLDVLLMITLQVLLVLLQALLPKIQCRWGCRVQLMYSSYLVSVSNIVSAHWRVGSKGEEGKRHLCSLLHLHYSQWD